MPDNKPMDLKGQTSSENAIQATGIQVSAPDAVDLMSKLIARIPFDVLYPPTERPVTDALQNLVNAGRSKLNGAQDTHAFTNSVEALLPRVQALEDSCS